MKLKNVKVGMKVQVKSVMVDTYYSVPEELKNTVQEVVEIDSSGHNHSIKITTSSGGTYWINHKNVKKVVE